MTLEGRSQEVQKKEVVTTRAPAGCVVAAVER